MGARLAAMRLPVARDDEPAASNDFVAAARTAIPPCLSALDNTHATLITDHGRGM